MAVVDSKSSLLTANDATTQTLSASYLQHGKVRTIGATVEVAATDNSTSKFRMARVRSNWRIIGIHVFNDALGGSCTADIGLYQTTLNGSAVVDADAYASAVSLVSASTVGTNVAWESAARDVSKIGQRVWEDAGLSADPQREYDIVVTLAADAASAGTVSLRMDYVVE